MNNRDKLQKLAEKKTGWTKADKEWLLPVLAEYGVEAPTKTSCQSCWRDAAIMALVKTADKGKVVAGMRLKGTAANEGVWWRGRLVNNATLTEELVEWLVDAAFPRSLYDIVENED